MKSKTTITDVIVFFILSPIIVPTIIVTILVRIASVYAVVTWKIFG